jgi:hypothetical protein
MGTNRNIVLIVNGAPEVGKDIFTSNIKKIFDADSNNDRIYNYISTVDHIKEIALTSFDWDGVKDESGRRLLSDLKDASTRYNSGPFKKVVSKIDNLDVFYDGYTILSIVHSREPDEISKFKEYYKDNCYTILIKRKTDVLISNHADANVDKYRYEYEIDNNGTLEEFYDKCIDFINALKIKIYRLSTIRDPESSRLSVSTPAVS